MGSAAPPLLDSQSYYFYIGRGSWRGAFGFRITDRAAFRTAALTLKERLLARGMALAHRLHSAAIHANGMSSTCYIPLLGVDWIASYTVHPDRTHIDGVLTCPWARATETIHKLA